MKGGITSVVVDPYTTSTLSQTHCLQAKKFKKTNKIVPLCSTSHTNKINLSSSPSPLPKSFNYPKLI